MSLFVRALGFELAEGTVVADSVGDTPCTFLTGLHRTERVIAERFFDADLWSFFDSVTG